MEFTTQRGGQVMIYEDYMYVINRKARDGRVFWRCHIRLWNVHDCSTIRTNFSVSINSLPASSQWGWHSRLNKIVGKAQPNIFELVDTFKKEQAIMEVDVTQRAVGAAPLRRSRQAVDRDRKIKELKERFEQNRSTLEDFIDGISAHTNL